ncbi:phosphotransferase [Chroococcidiopsis sp. CCNUC1]|jgi:thiamine kinase-like enzyme|uniref:phosphotransferase n=1 Tax=Chroococcidiopsis sp. CCNUC1 TaxID=2653189 RepID=UPI0020207F97|nr:phosphotransferase [Chroococcidiopsis sp. CCNUC1]URD51293.1 phosphotransferase [Chroococcidiopsis sp. CCNUC1]
MSADQIDEMLVPAAVLEQGLSRYWGRSLQIVAIESQPLDSFSTHPIDRLQVTLDDGQQLSVIFKQLQLKCDRHIRHRGKEVRIYERLLVNRDLGTPALYASLYDESNHRYWLFMEDVGEWKLEYCDVEEWCAAFRWLARLHATYYGQAAQLRQLDCLVEHGAVFYRYLADMARQSVQLYQPQAIARFDSLVSRLDELIAELEAQPHTLVHGDMSCQNLIVQPQVGIRPIDWEWAAIGVPAWDVAKLSSGWGTGKPRLLAAYCDEFARHAIAPLDRRAFDRTLAGCDILKILWYLRWWISPCRDIAQVDKLLDKIAERWHWLDKEENYARSPANSSGIAARPSHSS